MPKLIRAASLSAIFSAQFWLFVAWSQAQSPGPVLDSWDARVVSVQGVVQVFPAGSNGFIAATVGMPLDGGDEIEAKDGSQAQIGLSGLHLVSLGADSDMILSSDEKSATVFSLQSGTILAKIHHLLNGQEMEVQTPDAVAAVRGTQFGVSLNAGEATRVGVFNEGRVAVRSASGGRPEILTPNHETSVHHGGLPSPPHALRHFLRYRRRMTRMIRYVKVMRRRWKAMPAARRRALRMRMARRAVLRRRASWRKKRPAQGRRQRKAWRRRPAKRQSP
ncbi:MAG: FecR family protein [Elusimicrobiota bacterium]